MNIGQRVREVREDLGMQAAVLARRVEVAPNTIYRIEAGDRTPSVALLEKIAGELRIEPAELMREPAPLAEASETGPPAQASEYWSMIERLAEGLAEGYGVPVEDLLEVPEVALVLAGEDETPDQGQRGRTSRERTPEQLLEQLHEHGIRTNLSEASVLGQIVGMSDALVEEDPVEWERFGWLLAAAAASGLLTEEEFKVAREVARKELASEKLAGYLLQSGGFESALMISYTDEETPWDEAWAWITEQLEEVRRTYKGKLILRDSGEAIEVFVEQGAADAHERAIRDDVRRADALDRTRGRV